MADPYHAPPGSKPGSAGGPGEEGLNTGTSFAMVLGLVVVFLVALYLLPGRKASPAPDAGRPAPNRPAVDPRFEQLRQHLIDQFGHSLDGVSSAEQVQHLLQSQLSALQNDPRFTPAQRAEVQRRLQEAARQHGS